MLKVTAVVCVGIRYKFYSPIQVNNNILTSYAAVASYNGTC